jgi:hypothetical protein
MTDENDYAEWIKKNPPPDLQELVAKHGGYHRITPEAWREFDQQRETWEAKRKARFA